jgi:serine/threonine protein kinase
LSFIFRGVTTGLDYLHNTMNMANRDIKPDNILFATNENGTNDKHEDRAQIADFTTVVECTGEDFKVTGEDGTKAFMPPECFDDGREYSPKPVDIWSIGVSIYVTLFEVFPFDISSEDQLIEDIKKKQIEIPFGSESLREVLKCTLERDPTKRVTVKGLMQMDWFI